MGIPPRQNTEIGLLAVIVFKIAALQDFSKNATTDNGRMVPELLM
jgi:hypothetical protein